MTVDKSSVNYFKSCYILIMLDRYIYGNPVIHIDIYTHIHTDLTFSQDQPAKVLYGETHAFQSTMF